MDAASPEHHLAGLQSRDKEERDRGKLFFNGSKLITQGEVESGLLFTGDLRCRIQNAPLLQSASELSSGHEGPFGKGGGIRKGDRSVLARTAMRECDTFRKRTERLGSVKMVKATKLFFARA